MERKVASDYSQELLDLFHEYQHGDIDRRSFLNRAAKFAVGGLTVAAIFEGLTPNYAWAQQVPPDDKRIKVGYEVVQSPGGNGTIKGYLAHPAKGKKGNNIVDAPSFPCYIYLTMNEQNFPKTLLEAIKYFADRDNALSFMVQIHWPNGITCPWCDSIEHSFLATRRIWKCKSCRKQFSAKAGTIFEDSPIGLDKWFPAVWMIVNMKNGISSYELGKALGVMQKTAWFMLHRIRKAMQTGTFRKLSGQVEVDETFIGGKARNMHRGVLAKRVAQFATNHGTGRNQNIGKVAVMGLLERNGEVRTAVMANTKRYALHGEVTKHVEAGSTVYSDALASYNKLGETYIHNVIEHAEKYVDGHIHTNGIENFWSLLKRTLGGTYISVEPFHLFRYLDEQAFRFNTRKATDRDRFIQAALAITGKRLTFDELTGKTPKGYETPH